MITKASISECSAKRLNIYAALLGKWSPKINLVSSASLPQVWSRHIADSAQLLDLAPTGVRHWVDLGAGAGFPGAVIAILGVDLPDRVQVTLIESDQRKAAFLRAVSRETGVAFSVLAERIEDVSPLRADVVSARALAPVGQLAAYASFHLRQGGTALFLKGRQVEAEVDSARKQWGFDLTRHQSKTDATATVLEMKAIRRV